VRAGGIVTAGALLGPVRGRVFCGVHPKMEMTIRQKRKENRYLIMAAYYSLHTRLRARNVPRWGHLLQSPIQNGFISNSI